MKVSLNEVRKFTDVDVSVEDLVQKIGAQLGAVETVEHTGEKYSGVVVAKVISCEKHPNADKLSVCWIDDGGVAQEIDRKDGLVQVVCGAPNVREGLLVAWIPPGATVPSTYGAEPFVLGARELRGVVSNGMIASPSELALSDIHDGILEIDEDVQPGTEFKTLYGVDDVTIEIENKMFTHRPDCFGVLGVAREIAGIYGKTFVSPDWYLKAADYDLNKSNTSLLISVKNEIPELVPRFMTATMSNVQIKPSPVWLQALLTRIGVKPINNVVDITNYISHITAQPLHAYDYDKVKERSNGDAKLIVRKPRRDEQIALLNGKTITPREDAIMIATDNELIGIGGVMGGTTTEVDRDTKNIIIEVASFDMYSIRRTSMHHGLFTDAVTRFNKGQSPMQNDRVLAKAVAMMSELAGAIVASDVIDTVNCDLVTIAHDGWVDKEVSITAEFINKRLGLKLKLDDIDALLKNVEFGSDIEGDSIKLYAPFWRTDIAIKEDIVEEVGRLLGFDALPLELPKRTLTPTARDSYLTLKQDIRKKLSSLGANEVLTYSFVHGKTIDKAEQDKDTAFKLTNALSPDLQYYRLSMTPSLLEKIHPNIKAGHNSFSLFEIGKVHSKTEIDEENVPREFGRVSLVYASKNATQPAYYKAKKYIDTCSPHLKLMPFNLDHLQSHKLMEQMVMPYDPLRSAMLLHPNGYLVGIVGEFKPGVIKAFKLPQSTVGLEVFLSACETSSDSYRQLSRFPSVWQDICLEVDSNVSYGDLAEVFDRAIQSNIDAEQAVHTEPIDIFASQKIGDKKRITFRVALTSYERTLTDEVLSNLLDKVLAIISENINVTKI